MKSLWCNKTVYIDGPSAAGFELVFSPTVWSLAVCRWGYCGSRSLSLTMYPTHSIMDPIPNNGSRSRIDGGPKRQDAAQCG